MTQMDVDIGFTFQWDGQEARVAYRWGTKVYVAVGDGPDRLLDIEDLALNRDRQFSFPEHATPAPDDEAEWSLQGPAAQEDLNVVNTMIREINTGFRSGGWDSGSTPNPRYDPSQTDKSTRVKHSAEDHGLSESTIWRRLKAHTEGKRFVLTGRKARRDPAPFSHISEVWKSEARRLAREYIAEGESTPQLSDFIHVLNEHLDKIGVDPAERSNDTAALHWITQDLGLFDWSTQRQASEAVLRHPYGRVHATRPGEYVLIDSTRLDVQAMDWNTGTWVNCELSVAIDLFSRCILAIRVSPVSTNGIDIATLLFDVYRSRPMNRQMRRKGIWPFHGVPENIIIAEQSDEVAADDEGRTVDDDVAVETLDLTLSDYPFATYDEPSVLPETLVVDNGKVYVSPQVMSVCLAFGTNLRLGRPYKGSDKAQVERFFRTLRQQLLVHIPGYKGNNIFTRGRFSHRRISYTVQQLDAIIRDYIATVYHLSAHRSLHPADFPVGDMTPLQKFDEGVTRAGIRIVPNQAEVAIELLPVKWRAINKGGIHINNSLYRGAAIAHWVGKKSGWDEKDGAWPFAYNPDNIRSIFFKDPRDQQWHELLSADALNYEEPFSLSLQQQVLKEADHGVRRRRRRTHLAARYLALKTLSDKWDMGIGLTPKERRAAIRKRRNEATFSAESNGVQTETALPQPDSQTAAESAAPRRGTPSKQRREDRRTY